MAMLVWGAAQAVPARPGLTPVKQADGTTIVLQKVGDEFHHRILTADGLTVEYGADGNYYYRTATGLTSMRAHNAAERSAAEQAFVQAHASQLTMQSQTTSSRRTRAPRRAAAEEGSTQIPQTGSPRIPIILVEFSNKQFHDDDPLATYEGEFNTKEVSCFNYFRDQSQGKFTPQFDVIGPVTLENSYATYGRNIGNDDAGVARMVSEACTATDTDIDWSLYDNDGDGQVDVAIVLYAGMGEATCYDTNTVWPCQWSLSDAESYGDGNGAITLDGVTIDKFAVFNEMYGVDEETGEEVDQIAGIGTFCHEFSHCLGLPDFYDTNYGNHFGMGYWSLLDAGCYCGDGYLPCGYSAYERNFMGWMDLDTPEENTFYTLDAMTSEQPRAIKVVNDRDRDEYYILENRQNEGWDQELYSHGLMVTHVTFSQAAWDDNKVNDYDLQRMTLIPADGLLLMDRNYNWGSVSYEINKENQRGDLYPFNGNNQLTDESTPAATVNTGGFMGKPITAIAENEGQVSFWFMKKAIEVLPPQFTDTTAIDSTTMTLLWTPVENAASYTLQLTEASYEEPTHQLLLTETFPTTKFDVEGSVDISTKLDEYMDNAGWTGDALFKDAGGIRMGKSKGTGLLVSPEITLDSYAEKVTVRFTAQAYHSDTDVEMNVSCGTNTQTFTIADDSSQQFTAVLNANASKTNISFATTANRKRAIITAIEIYEGDASQDPQAARRLITITGDSLKLIVDGITDTCYTATDLLACGLYEAKVRANFIDGDHTDWSDSWSVQLHPASQTPALRGDINADGIVDVTDVNILIDIVLGKDQAENYDRRAFLSNDDIIDVADVNILIDIVLGK